MQPNQSTSLTLPARWPLHTQDPVRSAQIRVLLNTIVTDALAFWRQAPRRTWGDISRLVLRQMVTLDRMYPEAGILDSALKRVAVQFFAANVDARISSFGRREGDQPTPAVARLMNALRDAPRPPLAMPQARSTNAPQGVHGA
jgi:hypothetical protein